MFTVEYQRDGIRRAVARNVLPYGQKAMWRIPSFPDLAAKLDVPAYVMQALQRTTWDMAASDVLRADLTDKRGRPIGALIARWEVP